MELSNPFSLSGKKILVTGATSGIGKGIALACAKMGATVILSGRNEEKLKRTLDEMEGAHSLLVGDLTDFEKIPAYVQTLDTLNGVVHCAGINERVLAKLVTPADFDRTININLKAPVLLQAELLKQKKIAKEASIVFIASLGSESPSIGNSIYSASKGALISYTNCLALELAPRKIRVNCISPGMVWTELIMDNAVTVEELKEDEAKYPLKRYGTPEDIAHLALYLLSDASMWMTGSNVKITGGAR